MRKPLAAALLGLGLGALLWPVAAFGGTDVSPSTVRPGGTVEIRASCAPGVTGKASITGPNNFVADVILKPASDGARGSITAPGTVGVFKVSSVCDGVATGTTSFTVTPSGGTATGDGGRSDNTGLFVAGGTMVAIAVGGMVLMRRRLTASN
jgi:hypothetical protein